MILSMTGFGAAELRKGGATWRVEIRTVNNRYFKSVLKLPEHLLRFENDLDKLLRAAIGRGTVNYALRVKDDAAPAAGQINVAALGQYLAQLQAVLRPHDGVQIDLAGLLELPGVCEPAEKDDAELSAMYETAAEVTRKALAPLLEMRRVEGQALWRDLTEQCAEIRRLMALVAQRAPAVVEEYHRRLRTRVQQLVASASVELDQDALAREVAIFAERCDVNEELSRLASHLDQFQNLADGEDPAGRKLDFLAQEVLREANTIGSKANDAQAARHVVEIKAAVERIKEQVQNIE